ncbi:alpha/beta hydrolase [Kordia sp.]|uniref:alpha/beta hydrolase n=1 Tax=Kordia sp. TaxID=1965332 RepID=UPI003D6BDB44
MKRIHIKYYLLVLFIGTLVTSCNSDDDATTTTITGYQQTVIPTAIQDLYQAKGTATKDTVIVYAHGGPTPSLDTQDAEESQFQNYYRVYVKQAQHINQTIGSNEITFDQAIAEDNISTEMYYEVLKHFKDEGKVVIAMSHSFGSFILPNVLATKPNIADKVVIMAGRLDMPAIVWEGFRDGNLYGFPDGVTPTADGDGTVSGGELSATRLQAGLGKNRFTELLATKDITNVIYVFGTRDEAVGSLTAAEEQFLTTKNATVLKIDNGDHSSMFQPDALDAILGEIRQ